MIHKRSYIGRVFARSYVLLVVLNLGHLIASADNTIALVAPRVPERRSTKSSRHEILDEKEFLMELEKFSTLLESLQGLHLLFVVRVRVRGLELMSFSCTGSLKQHRLEETVAVWRFQCSV